MSRLRPKLAAMAAFVLVAGCSSPASTSAPAATSASSAGSSSSAASAAPASAAAGAVSIHWWGFNPTKQRAEELIAAFEKDHPEVQVTYDYYLSTDYETQLKLAETSGAGPDVMELQAGSLVSQYDPFVVDVGPLAAAKWGVDWASKYYDLATSQLKSPTGKWAGMPLFVSAEGFLWYNKTTFDKAGLVPPKTYADLMTLSKAYKTATGQPLLVFGAKDNWINFDMYLQLASQLAPGKIYQAEKGTLSWTDPGLVAAMDAWKNLFTDGVMQPGALGVSEYPDMFNQWIAGKAGMLFVGSWNSAYMQQSQLDPIKKSLGFTDNWEFVPTTFPSLTPNGQPGQATGGPDVILSLNSNRNAAQQAAAWTFVSWMADTPGQTIEASHEDFPALKGIDVPTAGVMYPASQVAGIQLEQKLIANYSGKREFLYPEIQAALGDALQHVASGTQTSQQALAAVDVASKAIQR